MRIADYIPLYKKNLNLAFPVILSQVGQVTVSLADNMMVGHAGTTELAAASFSNSIFHIGMLFGLGVTMGVTPLVGKVFSQKNDRQVGEYLRNGFFIHTVFALLVALAMVGVGFFLDKMGQPNEVAQVAFPYYLLLVASLAPMLMFYSFKQFFEGIGNTQIAMMITLTANLVNIVLNYLLIFGKYGFPELGLNGAGIATLISRLLMPVLLIPVLLKNKKYRNIFRFARQAALVRSKISELLSVGLPIGLQIIVEVLTFSLGAVMMGWLGKEPLAAHQVALGMASFTYMISLGVGAGTTIHVSHEFGAQNFSLLRRTVFASVHLVVIFMSFMGLLFILLRHQLPFLFTEDLTVVGIAAGLLVIAALFQVFDGLQVALLAALRGLSDVKIPMFMAFVSYSLIGLPISYGCAFGLNMGAAGIWFGFLVGLAVAAILFSLRLKKLVGRLD
ncbi:MATE family efflux transporter [Gaoshiqia sediminis]|uniref:Multidrug-efflux transporter n=1 Tax=Gaoshiqia sediminis TaxID=2986998 RepID=A0AA41Y2E5_9BACT|nr:MATE family efflux transporter [Gaoshiqia sediminis]MCW0482204.1 MATE family efflux transporter [Gaoshiqia sediminis]